MEKINIINGNSTPSSVNIQDEKVAECKTNHDQTLNVSSVVESEMKMSHFETSSSEILPNVPMKMLIPKIHIPSIEETIDFEHHKDYLDRFFTLRYCIDFNQEYNDFCILVHSNKLCVVTLAPSHPLVCQDIEIKKINFQVSKNINRLDNKTSGKHKRNAQNLNQTAPLCFVECGNDKVFTIYSTVPGKLLEMNDQLENDPQKIRECSPEFYHKQCYVAIILPSIRHTIDSLNKHFLTPEEYEKAMLKRNACKNEEC